ncbi:XkdX family protein [Bacillus spizizenii]|uniref:XkdX family protein n=1 Tax=Bacillus spizizenii TaxID=96241 RepID=UPI002E220EB9|nr:XkdX family protein [Bacillus spizizenii]
MNWYELIKDYFNNGNGVWDEYRVRQAVIKGKITPEQYEEIVGKRYEESAE